MKNYCTLFDSNYIMRGLAMYNSLKKYSKNFQLYIFAFDDNCYNKLNELKLENVTVISLNEFEDEELLEVKPTRTAGEYCWTSTPSTILYCIERYELESCTYLDADLYFFSNPDVLIDEMEKAGKSVLITNHRYTSEYDQSVTSGIYCVQFMTFKNDEKGLKVLKWWRNACLDWCYARQENGKFGDQKYLDTWPNQFEGIHDLENLGGGVAPWNIQQYIFDNNLVGEEVTTGNRFDLIFYHFHGFKVYSNNYYDCNMYELSDENIEYIYKPYINELLLIKKMYFYNKNTNDFKNLIAKTEIIKKYLRAIKAKLCNRKYFVNVYRY